MTHVNLTVQVPDWEGKTPEERRAWSLTLDQTVTNLGQITSWAVEGVPGDEESPQYGWNDFEPEPGMTGDGSGDPEKHFLTIVDPDGEEYASIVHRTAGGRFPIDGPVAEQKRRNAQNIVDALNAQEGLREPATDRQQKQEAPSPKDEVPTYGLELGVDARGARVCVLEVARFATRFEAEVFAREHMGAFAVHIKERARLIGKDTDDMDAQEGDHGLPVVGATVYEYTDRWGTSDRTDLP